MSNANSKLGAGRPSAGKSQKTLADVADKAATVRVNFDLDSEQHTKLRMQALKQKKTVKQFLTELIAQALD